MPELNFTENAQLITSLKSGNTRAREELIKNNLGLVKSIAKRFIDRGTDFEDLVELGTIGLIKAIDGFDESFGNSFSTYAYPLIIGEIKRFLRDDGIVKVSRVIKKNITTVLNAKDTYSKQHGKEPKISEICSLCNLSSEVVTEALIASSPIISLQDKLSESTNDDTTIEEMIPDKDFINALTDSMALRQEIANLSVYEKNIIHFRYFKNYSQTETARMLGQSQVTISRAERKIIDKLRQKIL